LHAHPELAEVGGDDGELHVAKLRVPMGPREHRGLGDVELGDVGRENGEGRGEGGKPRVSASAFATALANRIVFLASLERLRATMR
jgi:hypothetical protein